MITNRIEVTVTDEERQQARSILDNQLGAVALNFYDKIEGPGSYILLSPALQKEILGFITAFALAAHESGLWFASQYEMYQLHREGVEFLKLMLDSTLPIMKQDDPDDPGFAEYVGRLRDLQFDLEHWLNRTEVVVTTTPPDDPGASERGGDGE